jgi:hypothetical protein
MVDFILVIVYLVKEYNVVLYVVEVPGVHFSIAQTSVN